MRFIKPDAIALINALLSVGFGVAGGAIAMSLGAGWFIVSLASIVGAGLIRLEK